MKNLENLGILAGAVAVAVVLYKANKTSDAMRGIAMRGSDGQTYYKTMQADNIAADLGLLYV